ncbi:colicin v production transmembrane protein [Pandoraea thiooxydans]|uniref:Bacteriocin production protein n=1 Tax=Pandoraea thiooxydans TaxID=445709 RepID=A0A0G3EU75_9BURK|nr:CvpA family protein [Pandoraea thiooxydans]APR95903.1 colicin v production transmembrane protein [Pandoraea thiooxydans]
MVGATHGAILTSVDYLALVIVAGSMLLGMWRGFLREVFALIGWVVAFFVARALAPTVTRWLPGDLPGREVTQGLLAFVLVFVAVVFLAGIVNSLLGKLVEISGLRPADRGLGTLFGVVRGVVILMILVCAARLTDAPQQTFWQQSLLRPYVEQGLQVLRPFLPDAVAQYVPSERLSAGAM